MSLDQFLRIIFFLATAICTTSTLMFLARVHWPGQPFRPGGIFGVIATLLGIPSLGLAIVGINQGAGLAYWLMPLLYAGFSLFAFIVDYLLKIEFRRPPKLRILIPFVVLYFVSVMGLWGMTWLVGVKEWAIAGLSYFAMVSSSIYAARKGVG